MSKKLSGDARLMLWASLSVFAVILVAAFFAPARQDNDPVPSTWNTGSAGAKVAYLLLPQLGYRVLQWDKPSVELNTVDAQHTTLILAESQLTDVRTEKSGIAGFLKRGGTVLATGPVSALMLPESHIGVPQQIYTSLCYTTPQSFSAMGRAGQVAMPVPIRWKGTEARVDQACGSDAVVVHYSVGRGEVVWWSSSAPLNNRGLRQNPSLRLLLASIGAPGSGESQRAILFDEYIHGAREGIWATIKGTPVRALCWQLAVVVLLLLLSFSRRNGPLRALVQIPRTSPLEFAESMGALYQKAGATDVAVGAAQRRLMDFLHNEGGIPHETLRSTPDAIAAAVSERFFYTAPGLAFDLHAAQESEFRKLSAKGALELVRRIDRHIANLKKQMKNLNPVQTNGEKRD